MTWSPFTTRTVPIKWLDVTYDCTTWSIREASWARADAASKHAIPMQRIMCTPSVKYYEPARSQYANPCRRAQCGPWKARNALPILWVNAPRSGFAAALRRGVNWSSQTLLLIGAPFCNREDFMFGNWIQTTALITAALASAAIALAQAPAAGGRGAAPAPAPQKITQIKPNLYIVTGAGGNSTVRVTKAGIILVDTKNLGDQFYNELMTQIKTVSDQPVKEVIITHVHQDHSGNTGKFIEAGARVTANEGEKAETATYTSAAGKPAAPSATYATKTVVKVGGAKADVFHFGKGHTGGDSIVYFPDLKVVSGGDVIVGIQPNFDYPNGGSLLEAKKVLAEVAK